MKSVNKQIRLFCLLTSTLILGLAFSAQAQKITWQGAITASCGQNTLYENSYATGYTDSTCASNLENKFYNSEAWGYWNSYDCPSDCSTKTNISCVGHGVLNHYPANLDGTACAEPFTCTFNCNDNTSSGSDNPSSSSDSSDNSQGNPDNSDSSASD